MLILGVPRSGTTLLRRLFDAHPTFACPPETCIFSAAARMVEMEPASGAPIGLLEGVPAISLSRDQVLTEVREFAFRWLTTYATRQNKARWAEKSAMDVFHLPAIEAICGDRVQYVGVLRHAFDVAASLLELVRTNGYWSAELHPYSVRFRDPFEAACQAWVDGTRALVNLAERRPNAVHLLRYEDLVYRPHDTLQTLGHFLSAEWRSEHWSTALTRNETLGFGDWKTYGTATVHTNSVGRGKGAKHRQLPNELNTVLVRCGYPALDQP